MYVHLNSLQELLNITFPAKISSEPGEINIYPVPIRDKGVGIKYDSSNKKIRIMGSQYVLFDHIIDAQIVVIKG